MEAIFSGALILREDWSRFHTALNQPVTQERLLDLLDAHAQMRPDNDFSVVEVAPRHIEMPVLTGVTFAVVERGADPFATNAKFYHLDVDGLYIVSPKLHSEEVAVIERQQSTVQNAMRWRTRGITLANESGETLKATRERLETAICEHLASCSHHELEVAERLLDVANLDRSWNKRREYAISRVHETELGQSMKYRLYALALAFRLEHLFP